MPPARTADLVSFLDELLDSDSFKDYGPNGLQVPGPDEVETVVTGVSANATLLEAAADAGADLVLVHHGLFWRGQPLEITPIMHRRLKALYGGPMALAAYHLPLDGHIEHGNNVLLAKALQATAVEPFAEHDGAFIGVRARFGSDGIDATELERRAREVTGGRDPIVVDAGPDRIETIAIVSGAGGDYLPDALALGLDALLTGEPSERDFSIATDGGITYVAAGHHATETLGVQRLGALLEQRFGVTHRFINVPNPI